MRDLGKKNGKIETIGDLKKLLADMPDSTKLRFAAVPNVNGFIHWLNDITGQIIDGEDDIVEGAIVLSLTEECDVAYDENCSEVDHNWPRRPL